MKIYLLMPVLALLLGIGLLAPVTSSHAEDSVSFTEGIIFSGGHVIHVDIAHTGSRSKALESVGAINAQAFTLSGHRMTVDPVLYEYNPTGARVSQSIVDSGVELWNGLGGPKAFIEGETTLNASTCRGNPDGRSVIAWYQMSGGVLGVACWVTGTNECDIELNSHPGLSYQDRWRSVTAHEVGHCYGLLHSEVPAALMYPMLSSNKGLHSDDVAGFCFIYSCQVPSTPTSTLTATRTPITVTATPTATATNTPIPPTATRTVILTPTATATQTLAPPPTATPTKDVTRRQCRFKFCLFAINVSK